MHNTKTIGPWLGKTTKMLTCYLNETLSVNNIELTFEQWLVLAKLHLRDRVMQSELALITERDKTSLTRLINTMERKGLVLRKKNEKDKRVKFIYLTTEGTIAYNKALPVMKQSIAAIQNGLTEKEIENTIHTLQKLQTNLSNMTTQCGIKQL